MTKPWDEAWNADEWTVDMPDGDEAVFGRWYDDMAQVVGRTPRDVSRARLASAAPDLVRVLLAIEWVGRADYVGDGGYDCCPSCGGIAPEGADCSDAKADIANGQNVVGHKPDCALDAALRKAGVR